MGKQDAGYGPILDDFVQGSTWVLPLKEWWNQIIWSTSTDNELTRKDIVLVATNQDGGAHVDKTLNEKYEEYSTMSHGKVIAKGNDFRKEVSITEMHLLALRTMGNEVMKSPDFLALLE